MTFAKRTYNRIFSVLLVCVLVVCYFTVKVSSTNDRFISADGLGYYAYLPAQFIYGDTDYKFEWFNDAYHKHYSYDMFGPDNRNFFVPYKNRTINKYYQGMSFLWLPFFLPAHAIAKVSGAPADGFSAPYQYSILIAAICYLLLGLVFLRRLLLKLFGSEWIALLMPMAFFYGSYLFYYTVSLPSHSHVYSFTLITLFLYFAQTFFNEPERRWTNGLLCLFCLVMIVSVRPLNGIIVLTLPGFIPNGFFRQKLSLKGFTWQHGLIVLLTLSAVIYHYRILYRQTGTFFPDTYTNERFYFFHPKLYAVLLSYHAGLFVYVPLAFLAVAGIFFMPFTKQKLLLPLTFFIVVYLYSAWWYWPITSRTLIDFYAILAILAAALLKKLERKRSLRIAAFTLVLVCTAYFQLKAQQVYRGILDVNYTYSELFWKNFFRWRRARIYAVPPQTIIKQQTFTKDFETGTYEGLRSEKQKCSGNYSAVLDDKTEFTPNFTYKLPDFFKEKGLKKMRFSFNSYYAGDIRSLQLTMVLLDKANNPLGTSVFYIEGDNIRYNTWELEQYGREFTDEELAAGDIDHVSFYVWNSGKKNAMFIDDVKVEFFLTDKSYEIVQEE